MKLHIGERGTVPLPAPVQTLLKQVISSALRLHRGQFNPVNCEINLTFVTETEITELNKQYRNKGAPTDVLSFPSMNTASANLGDIVICLQVAEEQAQEYGHSLERELAFLTAHGFLHLIGYDHTTPEEEEPMLAMQKQIMSRVGVER